MTDTPSPEALKAARDEWFAFFCRKYVQRADERQKAMGLQYTEAETHDLAKEVAQEAILAIDRAVTAERERTAKCAIAGALLAGSASVQFVTPSKFAADLARDIADAIRSGDEP